MIIAIEGIDGSGKNTQSTILCERLSESGYKTVKIGFPSYKETFFGKEVGNYLNGLYGSLDVVPPKLAAMLYAGDRFEKKDYILDELNNGSIIIMDRYVSSNIAHQSAKLSGNEQKMLSDWVEQLEFDVYGLPKPDLNILLDLDVQMSRELVLRKDTRDYTDKNEDLHEENSEYLADVALVYRLLASSSEHWHVIDCIKDNKLRTVGGIANEVFEKVMDKINSSAPT